MAVEAITRDRAADGVVAERRPIVLIALGDAAHAEHLSSALAASGDLLPVTAGGSDGGERADVAVIDEEGQGRAIDPAIPRVLLSRRTRHEPPAENLYAVLPTAADDLLIVAAVRLAAAGYRVSASSRRALGRHDDDFAFHDGDALDEEPVDDGAVRPALSPRENEVLALLAEGAPNKVIARRLNISVHTAKFHVAAILIKLGAANRTDAIAIAMRQGLVLV